MIDTWISAGPPKPSKPSREALDSVLVAAMWPATRLPSVRHRRSHVPMFRRWLFAGQSSIPPRPAHTRTRGDPVPCSVRGSLGALLAAQSPARLMTSAASDTSGPPDQPLSHPTFSAISRHCCT